MKIKKTSIISIIFILSIIITGCNSFDIPQASKEIEYKVTGNEALDIRFWKDSPPSQVYTDDSFDIRLDLENLGTQNIENGIINTLVENKYIKFKNEKNKFINFKLEGKKDYYPGEKKTETIELISTDNIDSLDAKDTTVIVNVCYDYFTEFGETICIDTDINGVIENKPCTVQDISTFEGQGAPIMITNVAEKVSSGDNGVKITFEIDISNKGQGNVISYDSINKICGEANAATSIETEDLNIINIEEVQFSNYKLSEDDIICTPRQFNIMKDKYLRCTTRNPIPVSLGTFSTEFSIKLKYGYMETTKKNIQIQSLS